MAPSLRGYYCNCSNEDVEFVEQKLQQQKDTRMLVVMEASRRTVEIGEVTFTGYGFCVVQNAMSKALAEAGCPPSTIMYALRIHESWDTIKAAFAKDAEDPTIEPLVYHGTTTPTVDEFMTVALEMYPYLFLPSGADWYLYLVARLRQYWLTHAKQPTEVFVRTQTRKHIKKLNGKWVYNNEKTGLTLQETKGNINMLPEQVSALKATLELYSMK